MEGQAEARPGTDGFVGEVCGWNCSGLLYTQPDALEPMRPGDPGVLSALLGPVCL